MGRTPTKEKKCLTLKDYIDFLENPHSHDHTISYFNQIIYIHGFQKLHRSPKKDVIDALNNLDLLCSYRSSLKEKKSSSSSSSSSCVAASLTTEEVLKDLVALQWQECSLQSIETLNSMKENKVEELQISSISSDNNSNKKRNKDLDVDVDVVKKTKGWKAKKKNLQAFGLGGGAAAAANAVSSYWLGM